jgi:hypothetical protein
MQGCDQAHGQARTKATNDRRVAEGIRDRSGGQAKPVKRLRPKGASTRPPQTRGRVRPSPNLTAASRLYQFRQDVVAKADAGMRR